MKLRILSLFAAVALVAACETAPEATADTDAGGQMAAAAAATEVTPGSFQDFVNFAGNDRVFFGFDRYDLTEEAQETIRKQAEWLHRYPNVRVVIEGHADERGTREYNLGLGERRANSVRDALIARQIPGERIRIISYGKERPAVAGSNEWAWSQNRRAVVVFN